MIVSLVKSAINASTRWKLIVITAVLALIGASSIIALRQPDRVIDTVADYQVVDQQAKPSSTPASSATDSAATPEVAGPTASTTPPAAKPTNSSSTSQQPSKPKYDNSTALPPTVVTPIVDFGIVISPWSVTNIDAATILVPFSIKHIGNHNTPISSFSGQVQPSALGISCTPFFSTQDLGEIQVHVPGSVSSGQYTCQVSMSDGTRTRSAQFTFTVTNGSVTTP